MHLGARGQIFDRAQYLRRNQTKAEKYLWQRLRKNQLGVKFRRQHPVLNYIADFYCHQAKLVIELDGLVHDEREQQFHDRLHTEALNENGIAVMRFTNNDVLLHIESVIEEIKSHLTRLKNSASPSGGRGLGAHVIPERISLDPME